MKVEYRKEYSRSLGREMEFKIYGHGGTSALVFPSQNGRFFDYEDFGMVETLAPYIESGRLRLVCADSIDSETWSDTSGNPRYRIELHERWYNYIVNELVPRAREITGDWSPMISTGCSMGGFHSANFFFRRPDIFGALLAQSGLYNADYFFGNYSDDLVYTNSPLSFIPNMRGDHPHMNAYRGRRIIFSVGQGAWEDDLLGSTRIMDGLLRSRGVPAWVDYWGGDVTHDWFWWKRQVGYFMDALLG